LAVSGRDLSSRCSSCWRCARRHARRREIGIVFTHGEAGAPGRVIVDLTDALEKAVYLVSRPDMCWSARRSYEASFAE
jgi:hypothetical protein